MNREYTWSTTRIIICSSPNLVVIEIRTHRNHICSSWLPPVCSAVWKPTGLPVTCWWCYSQSETTVSHSVTQHPQLLYSKSLLSTSFSCLSFVKHESPAVSSLSLPVSPAPLIVILQVHVELNSTLGGLKVEIKRDGDVLCLSNVLKASLYLMMSLTTVTSEQC